MTTALNYQNILVATDFSPTAESAIQQALWLARKSGAKITVTHVLTEFGKRIHAVSVDDKLDLLYGDGAKFNREILADCHQRFAAIQAKTKAMGVNLATKPLIGEPFVEICRAVEVAQHDLVIMGTRGLSGWKAFFVGSTAQNLIRRCSSQVWIVKSEHVGSPQVVLAATDFSDVSYLAIRAGLTVAEAAGSEFHLLHVIDSNDVSNANLGRQQLSDLAHQRLDEFISKLTTPINVSPHISWGIPWQEIQRLVEELKVDLLALGAVGRGGIPGLFLGNTAEKVLSTCDCSLLTVKPHDFKSTIPLVESTSPFIGLHE